MRVYVASSWKNKRQPEVVAALRKLGHEVYDFRHPEVGNRGFAWEDIDPCWRGWTPSNFVRSLNDKAAEEGFAFDMAALDACDACVLVLPCGKSAHLEAGYAAGKGKFTAILLDDTVDENGNVGKLEPELMYKMCNAVCVTLEELLHTMRPTAALEALGLSR